MKQFSPCLIDVLATGLPIYKADLFQIGPCDNGAMIYATNGQAPITYLGNVYQPIQFGAWSRGTVTTKIGLESNSVDLTVFADNQVPVYFPGTSNGALLLDGIKYGLLGQAPVTVFTAYMLTYGVLTAFSGGYSVETKFVGMMANIKQIGMTKAVITVQDMLYLLNIQVPRRVFQASCSHTLYDTACTLLASNFQRAGAVSTITYPYQFTTTAHLAPISAAGTFTLGWIKWTGGKNAGLVSMVRQWTAGSTDTIQLDVQPIFGITAGDTFQIHQGCNKTFTSCLDLQGSTNAYINHGGQEFIPVPETAI